MDCSSRVGASTEIFDAVHSIEDSSLGLVLVQIKIRVLGVIVLHQPYVGDTVAVYQLVDGLPGEALDLFECLPFVAEISAVQEEDDVPALQVQTITWKC